MELAAGAAAVQVHGAHLEFDVQAQGQAVQLEQHAALVVVADLGAVLGPGLEGEATGGEVEQAVLDPFVVGQVADLGRYLDPGVLALGFGFVHHIDVDGCIHGLDFLFKFCHTNAISVATNTLVAVKVMAREDQVLNQRVKLARSRLSLVFWRVQDCWSRRKKT